MKTSLLLISLMVALKTYGQSDSIERAIFYNKLKSKKISATTAATIIEKWEEKIKKEKYPELPINKNGKIQYSFILEFPNIMKEKLCNRILEWLSINYGIFPVSLYSNLEDGKIICSYSINIENKGRNSATAYYTYVFSVKNEKILIEFINIICQVPKSSFITEDPKMLEYKIDELFPIILKDSYDWIFYFNLLKRIDKHFKNDVKDLNYYINNYEKLYRF